jgi:type II secretory pathway pseudopilin PulG
LVVLAGGLAIPAGWLIPPWLAAGNALQASMHARAFHGNLGPEPLLEVLKRATNLSVWPVIIAFGAVALLAVRTRDWVTVTLAGMALAYIGVVEIMTLAGYPGLERFMLPAAAVACVLAGVFVARVAALAGGGVVSLVVVAALVGVSIPFFAGRLAAARTERHTTQQAVQIYNQLTDAAHNAAAAGPLLPCPTSRAAVNHTSQTSLAWILDAPMTHVLTVTDIDSSLRRPALAFFAPRNPITGGAPTRLVHHLRRQFVTGAGIWKVYRVTRPGQRRANVCVGG